MRPPFAALGLEQLVPSFNLAVIGILDLQPGRTAAVALMGSTRPLGHDALEMASGNVAQTRGVSRRVLRPQRVQTARGLQEIPGEVRAA